MLRVHSWQWQSAGTPLYGRRDNASARWLSADLMYEGEMSIFQMKHIQKISRSKLMHSLLALRPVHSIARTCMLSVITCMKQFLNMGPQRLRPRTTGQSSKTLMFLGAVSKMGGSTRWLQPKEKSSGKSSCDQQPASQSLPIQAPKPRNEESEYIGMGCKSRRMHALPLKQPQKHSHQSRSASICSSSGIALACLE